MMVDREAQELADETLRYGASHLLRKLTAALQKVTGEGPHGLLGGEDGYGVEYTNDVFEMHPYWWGDCECGFEEQDALWDVMNSHDPDCYQNALVLTGVKSMDYRDPLRREIIVRLCAQYDLDPEYGCLVHCTCDYNQKYATWRETNDHDPSCGYVRPNFRHHATGVEVRWYKYIGRGMEFVHPGQVLDALRDAIQSVVR